MKNKKKRLPTAQFWMLEAALLIVFVVCYQIMVGYKTIALSLFAITTLVAIYRLIYVYSAKNKKMAKLLKTVLTYLVCVGLSFFAVIEIFVISSAHTDKNPEAPYLVVLGAGVNGTVPSLALEYRLEAAKQYLDEYPEAVAIVSGGQGEGEHISEAECMHRWLVQKGIAEDRILMEPESTSTQENLKYSLEIIRKNGGDPTGKVAIVSGEYHLYRAKYMARELGAEPIGVAAHTRYPILMTNYFIREAFGVAYLWIM